jgi:hypothetical protein
MSRLTFRGIVIDVNDESENVNDSICLRQQSLSKETEQMDLHLKKQPFSMISTLRGIVIDCSDE